MVRHGLTDNSLVTVSLAHCNVKYGELLSSKHEDSVLISETHVRKPNVMASLGCGDGGRGIPETSSPAPFLVFKPRYLVSRKLWMVPEE